MKKFFFILLSLSLFTCAHESGKTEFHCLGELKEFVINAQSISGHDQKFIAHTGEKKFENYVTVNLDYSPFAQLSEDIQKTYGQLKNRGEAHVTAITPPEFDDVLSSFLTMKEINALAEDSKIQNAQLNPVCLGHGQSQIAGKAENVYFIVLESKDLLAFRRRVFDAFVAKGGSGSRFDPENFYPHITVGFSLRDLHESDGVRKGKNSCVAQLKLKADK